MAITSAQRTQLIQLAVGMFHAAPGSDILAVLEDLSANGYGAQELARLIAGLPAYQSSEFYSPTLDNSAFADRFVNNLIGDYADQEYTDALRQALVGSLDAVSGTSPEQARGDAEYLVITALASLPASDAAWGRAAARFANQVAVADYYSVGKQAQAATLAGLQSIVAPVTDARLSVPLMVEAIDAALQDDATAAVPAPNLAINAGLTSYGGAEADTLTGTAGNDVLLGGEGADKITGESGTDHIDTGAGDDSVFGAQQHDLIEGGAGKDTLFLTAATLDDGRYLRPADILLVNIENIDIAGESALTLDLTGQTEAFAIKISGAAAHIIVGGSGNDTLTGGNGNDTLDGGSGNDTVKGGSGDNLILAGSGTDNIDGGAGSDTLMYADPTDTLNGGAGDDTLHFSLGSFEQPVDARISGIENIAIGGDADIGIDLDGQSEGFAVTMSGDGAHQFIGGSGSDNFLGARATDTLDGGSGTDTLTLSETYLPTGRYEPAADQALKRTEIIAIEGDAPIVLDLHSQTEAFTVNVGGTAAHTLTTGAGADIISGGAGDETLSGGSGADVLTGNGGTDRIDLTEDTPARDIVAYAGTTDFGDEIVLFSPGSAATADQIEIPKELLEGVGGSKKTAIGVTTVAGSTALFSLDTTVVIVRDATVTSTDDLTAVAALLDAYGNNASYAASDRLIFVVGDAAGNSGIYHFASDGANDIVSDTELARIATLTGVAPAALDADNFTQ